MEDKTLMNSRTDSTLEEPYRSLKHDFQLLQAEVEELRAREARLNQELEKLRAREAELKEEVIRSQNRAEMIEGYNELMIEMLSKRKEWLLVIDMNTKEILRRKVPDEIKNYQRMLSNKENIIADARAKADSIIADAQVQTTELISDHEIMQQAYERADEVVAAATNEAQEILDRAAMDADAIRMGAIEYTDSILKEIEEILASAMETTQARSENLLHSLQGCYDEIRSNRGELGYDGMQTASLQDAEATQNT